MKKIIREFILSMIFAWGLLAIILMMRYYENNNTVDSGYALIYFASMGAFTIYTIFYAVHTFKHTKSKNPFRSPSFEEDERRL